jgi:hypothetical protein
LNLISSQTRMPWKYPQLSRPSAVQTDWAARQSDFHRGGILVSRFNLELKETLCK